MLAECYGKTIEDIGEIAALCEIVHNGTLIVDDIEDSRYLKIN
jgi:geranylgeranyl pyrophosphate synthase